MKHCFEILLLTVAFGTSTFAVFVDPPAQLTLLPQSASLLFNTIYKTLMLANTSMVYDSNNACKDQLQRSLQKTLFDSGNSFHNCYNLNAEQVASYIAASNETQLLEKFQQDVSKCPVGNTLYYEFNCYVKVIQSYLQDIDSYVHKPNNQFEWNLQYQLALIRYKKLTFCTGAELKTLMEHTAELITSFAKC